MQWTGTVQSSGGNPGAQVCTISRMGGPTRVLSPLLAEEAEEGQEQEWEIVLVVYILEGDERVLEGGIGAHGRRGTGRRKGEIKERRNSKGKRKNRRNKKSRSW